MSCDDAEPPPTVLAIDQAVEAFEDAFCNRLEDCGCEGEWLPTHEQCVQQIENEILQLREAGQANDLTYDGACLGALLDRLDDRGCGQNPRDDDVEDACERPCYPYHGGRAIGQSCSDFGQFSDCAQGLRCSIEFCESDPCTGTCTDPCRRAAIGETCNDNPCVDDAYCAYDGTQFVCREAPGAGDACPEFDCGADLLCDPMTMVCLRLPGVDEPCLQGSCKEGLFCVTDPFDPTVQTCKAEGGVGDACMGHVQCESEYCPAGFCAKKPGKGDECFGVCEHGYDCDFETSTCVEATPDVCDDDPL
jgi:hypothetical protein